MRCSRRHARGARPQYIISNPLVLDAWSEFPGDTPATVHAPPRAAKPGQAGEHEDAAPEQRIERVSGPGPP